MPLAGKSMVDALAAIAENVKNQTITRGSWSINISEVRNLTGPLFNPIPLSLGVNALALRLTLTIDGVERITPSYIKEVVNDVPILDDWWCVILAHEIPNMNNNELLEYFKGRLIAFAEAGTA